MPAILSGRLRAARALVVALVAVALLSLAPVGHADAAVVSGSRVVSVASTFKGTPYVWGGTTPRGFDCSGYVRYVYAKLGKHLPRTAAQQYLATRHISKASIRVGDLVFFHHGRNVYHVGIYAGNNTMWDAPRPGKSVRHERIWTTQWWAGRVR